MTMVERRETGRILVADDSPLARGWVVGCLSLAGYEVIGASDGEEALEKALSEAPEVILLDAVMPKLGGPEVWRRLKRDPETAPIPIVLMIPQGYRVRETIGDDVGCDALLGKPVDRRGLLALVRSLLTSSRITRDGASVVRVLQGLGAVLEARDLSTKGHSERVGQYAFRLGMRLGRSPRECESLRFGALLHDIGKIGVADSVLSKPGPLSEEESEEVRSHAQIGARILEGFGGGAMGQEAVLHHHERWDGTGYPDGLKGEAIPLAARILAVVDSYDTLVSGRPYQRAVSATEAAAAIRQGRTTRYDPMVADAFLGMVGS
ncbi:MAG: HD domain-containing phosphohydrolase [Dehalococcoidia bacterium]